MAGYLGQSQPVAAGGNSVETADIIDGAVTDTKLNSTKLNAIESGATADQTKADIDALGINAAKVNSKTVLTNVPTGAVFTDTNTTYSVGDGGLTQKNFTTTLKSKLDGVASSANNYTHPSAHSISEVTNLQTELDDIETLALAGL